MPGDRFGHSRLALLAALVVVVAVAGCGRGSTAKQRIDRCVEGNLVLQRNGTTVAAGVLKQSFRRLCGASERAGYLDDLGTASAEHNRSILQAHADMLAPYCKALIVSEVGDPDFDESYLPAGGVDALIGRFCRNLRAYINAEGNRIDTDRMWNDRGASLAVPVCRAGGLTVVADQARVNGSDWHRAGPFSRRDWLKLLTSTCRRAWAQGLFPADGTYNEAAFEALFRKTGREMVRSGEVTVLS